jgi:hypothetical protein
MFSACVCRIFKTQSSRLVMCLLSEYACNTDCRITRQASDNLVDMQGDMLKLYAVYCSNQPNISNLVKTYKQEKEEFASYLQVRCCALLPIVLANKQTLRPIGIVLTANWSCMHLQKSFRRKECRKLDMESFLIMPLQRLCKYPLLLKVLPCIPHTHKQ